MKYDIIIIFGGGLGGLTAGAILTHEGKKVCCLKEKMIRKPALWKLLQMW
jgi:phytoene dehydrogenase-like protein